MMRTRLAGAFCLLVPVVYLATALHYAHPPAGVFLQRDATYYYVMNSFLVAQGKWAHYYAHPGGVLQLFGGALVRAAAFLLQESGQSLQDGFIRLHSQYSAILGTAALCFNAALLAWAGLAFRRWGLPLAAVAALQLLWVSIPLSLNFNSLFQPESFCIGIGAALGIALVTRPRRLPVSLLAGGALAVKSYFLPYLALPLAFQRRRDMAFAFAGSFLVLLLASLVLFPEWKLAIEHHWGIAVASRKYAEGPPGLPSLEMIRSALSAPGLAQDHPLLLLAFALGISGLFLESREDASHKRVFMLFFAVFAFEFLCFLRKPTSSYYLLPTLTAAPPVLAAFFRFSGKRWRLAGYLLLAIVLLAQLKYASFQIRRMALLDSAEEKAALRLESLLNENQSCRKLLSGPIPLGVDALHMGADWSGGQWWGYLDAKFPDYRFLNPALDVRGFSPETLPFPSWLASQGGACVLLVLNPAVRERAETKLNLKKPWDRLECNDFYCAYRFPEKT